MNVNGRVRQLEKATIGDGECQCVSVDGVSGLRVVYSPEDGAPVGAMSDTVAVCVVCGRERPTLKVVYDDVSERTTREVT